MKEPRLQSCHINSCQGSLDGAVARSGMSVGASTWQDDHFADLMNRNRCFLSADSAEVLYSFYVLCCA